MSGVVIKRNGEIVSHPNLSNAAAKLDELRKNNPSENYTMDFTN